QGDNNIGNVLQMSGEANTSSLTQTGNANYSTIVVQGTGNQFQGTQTGAANSLDVNYDYYGVGILRNNSISSTLTSSQTGDNNSTISVMNGQLDNLTNEVVGNGNTTKGTFAANTASSNIGFEIDGDNNHASASVSGTGNSIGIHVADDGNSVT